MLVYGDVECVGTVGDKLRSIAACLDRMASLPPGSERHEVLVAAFVETGELVQALIDDEFHERGFDALSPVHGSGMESLFLLARNVVQSWQSGFSHTALPGPVRSKLLSFEPERIIRAKQAEGYAFYALYPESYVEAALRSGLGPDTQVIGIRSIGTGLSALVAAALDAPPPITVRPVGHPFQREIKIDPTLTAMLAAKRDAVFAVVDEGPGLSGSSFGAVADWLEALGIDPARIHFFPSHAGDLGPQASLRHRERWSRATRHFVSMDELLRNDKHSHLMHWVECVTGSLTGNLKDISGGAWRSLRYREQAHWPEANIQQERRKFLAQTDTATWLVKFAGLGDVGWRKYSRAQQLHRAGFSPEVIGCCHGFLIQRWHGEAPSLDQHPIPRDRLVRRIGAYLGFRARQFPAQPHQGASLVELRDMALYNTQQALGEQAAMALSMAMPGVESVSGAFKRVFSDNRMQPWEWIVAGDQVLKTDALDHCTAHDLVGCQDITWDIAGTAVEFGLSDRDTRQLCAIVQEESGHSVSAPLLSFMLPCYLAFQVGSHVMAATALQGSEEESRLRRAAERYGNLMRSYLQQPERQGFEQEQDKVPAS